MLITESTIIFDLDGTLVDTEPDLTAALNKVLRDSGHSSVPASEVASLIGDGALALLERGFQLVGQHLTRDALMVKMDAFINYYGGHLADKSRPFSGVEETLKTLHSRGAQLVVCTNKRTQFSQQLLEQIGLSHYFIAIVGGDALPVRKPDPRHVLAALELANGKIDRAVMVGDSMKDIAAARSAGVSSIAVTYGYGSNKETLEAADGVITYFPELPDAIVRLP